MQIRFLSCFTAVVAILLVSPAHASERVWSQASGSFEYTCKPGEQVAIEGVNNTATLSGLCGSLRIEGAGNQVHANAIDHVQIDGTDNQVLTTRLIDVSVEGANNVVTWSDPKAIKPKILQNEGIGNHVHLAAQRVSRK